MVDNSRWIARLIKNQLMDIGFEDELISIATDGHQAYLILDLKEFDLVTSGLYMKAQNGLDMLIKVRNDSRERMKHIPFLVVSAERTEGHIDEVANAGASGYLTKPFLNDELAQMVDIISNNPTGNCVRIDQKYKPTPILYDPSMDDIGIHPKVIAGFIESAVEAFSQYLVTAIPGQPQSGNGADGDFVVSVDFVDEEHEVRVVLLIYFPKKIACDIYETIFGELDMTQVGEVVKELGNIIGGIAKIKAAKIPHELLKLINGGRPVDPRKEIEMHFQMGLPESWEDGKESLNLGEEPKFTVPFTVEGENAFLQVYFQHT
ncbi:MAG: response regulator [Nitrospinae bacterium]|nr:response regulator [Nitrospinota bacterium]